MQAKIGTRYIGFILTLLMYLMGNTQDLPPGNSVPTQFDRGSLIIPLNKSIQNINGNFNLRAYGLVYRLLEEGIDVSWVIKNNKQKDEADLIVRARELGIPNANEQWLELISSAFVIDLGQLLLSDCTGETKRDLDILEFRRNFGFEDIRIFETAETMEAEARYRLKNSPAIAILTDGTYQETHMEVLDEADIPYSLLNSRAFFEEAGCYNVITQPHIEANQIFNQSYYTNLDNFVRNGGNFIAQCSSIKTFEQRNGFQVSGGIDVHELFDFQTLDFSYQNADQAIMQFEGDLPISIIGTVLSFKPTGNGFLRNNAFVGVKERDYNFISSADMNGAAVGGNVIYIGGHDYIQNDEFSRGQQYKRVLMNSLFIPAANNFACAGENICICRGEQVRLGCESLNPGLTYRWSPSAGLSCTDCPNPIASPKTTTVYTMEVEGHNECGTSSVEVKVLNNEPLDLGPDLVLCPGEEAQLDATNSDAENYLWSDGFTLPVRTVTANGIYRVTVSTDKCQLVDSAQVFNLAPGFLGPDEEICNDYFEIDPGLPVDLLWNDQTIAQKYGVDRSGLYWAKVTLANCELTDTVEVTLIPNDLNLPDAIEKCVSEWVDLDAGMGDYFQWSSGEATPLISVKEPGYYVVGKRISNCRYIDSVLIKNISCGECLLDYPNIFSPNIDGANDFWMLEKKEDCLLSRVNLKIYDRWGAMMYQTDDFNKPWDGSHRGEKAPIGVYIFSAEVEDTFGEIYKQQGDFMLVR